MKKTKTITVIEDDLDGGEAAETIKLGLNDDIYEIDLNERNAAQLREDIGKYLKSGRKLNGRPKSKAKSTRKRSTTKAGPTARDVRAWALEAGIRVPAHGRIPGDVMEAYRTNHGLSS